MKYNEMKVNKTQLDELKFRSKIYYNFSMFHKLATALLQKI